MSGLSTTMEIAKGTLLNTQLQIQTASHNIANAESLNYSRQKAATSTNPAVRERSGWLGQGAQITRVTQARDQFVESRLLGTLSSKAYHETRSSALKTAEAYMTDDGESGLSRLLGEFWASWDILNMNPDGVSEKESVLQAAQDLASQINGTWAALEDSRLALLDEAENQETRINELLRTIADFNHQIAYSETPTHAANDLRDKRYQAMKELADYIAFDTAEIPGGAVVLSLDGHTLVAGSEVVNTVDFDPSVPALDLKNAASTTTATLTDMERIGGKLGGLATAADAIAAWQNRLDAFSQTLADQVNALHPGFFTVGAPPSSTLAVSLASASAVDGSNALDIAQLQTATVTFGTPPDTVDMTFSGYWSDIQRNAGTEVASSEFQADFQDALANELESQRQNISGVSIDEEMVDLLKYQQLYQAAAKLIQNTANMLQTAIDMVP